MTQEQFKRVTEWQRKTFPGATMLSKIKHLLQELEEVQDPSLSITERSLEFADCFLLLFDAAAASGMTYDSIVGCIDAKMGINENRKWGNPDADGVVNHIKI